MPSEAESLDSVIVFGNSFTFSDLSDGKLRGIKGQEQGYMS